MFGLVVHSLTALTGEAQQIDAWEQVTLRYDLEVGEL